MDLWAAGVTLFVILSGGKNPFVSKENKLQLADLRVGNVRFDELIVTYEQAKSSNKLFAGYGGRKISGSDDSPRRKPHPLSNAEQLMRLLLTVDPSRRPTAAGALAHPWFVQHGLACAPPGSPLERGPTSMDSSSLEASPPTMEPILNVVRRGATQFEMNIEENDAPPVISRLASGLPSGLPNGLPNGLANGLNSLTIGPRGSTEGKVVRCD